MDVATPERSERRAETERQIRKLQPIAIPILVLTVGLFAWILLQRILVGDVSTSVQGLGLSSRFAWVVLAICTLDIVIAFGLAWLWIRKNAHHLACLFAVIVAAAANPPHFDPATGSDGSAMFWVRFVLNCSGLILGVLGIGAIFSIVRHET